MALRKRSEATVNDSSVKPSCRRVRRAAPVVDSAPVMPKAVIDSPWRKGMNDEQAQVIEHMNGPLFVPSQAGTGKTRALVNRVARLVNDGVRPERILGVTFSKKAADEMNKRLNDDLGIVDCRIGTWHSLAMQILREDFHPSASWKVDEKDRHKVNVKEACGWRYLDWKTADVTKVRSFIGFCKANLWAHDAPETIELARERFGSYEWNKAVQAYKISDELTHGAALLTFDDMLVFVARHLSVDCNAGKWGGKWDYILQDEAQDANRVQMIIAESLAKVHRNYMIVGDPAQSIYGFRGSSPEHFMGFAEKWGAQCVYMNRNYRSGRAIVNAANKVIAPAATRLPVEMIAMRDYDGSAQVVTAESLDDEAELFVSWIATNKEDGRAYSDMACLFRTNAQSRALEEALISAKVPYVIIGGASFYERKEIKDILGYLRVAANRDEDGDAVRRCINTPFRYLGAKFVEKVMQLSSKGCDWPSVVNDAARQTGMQSRQRESAETWCDIIERLAFKIDDKPSELLNELVKEIKFIEWLEKDEGEESIENSTGANVRELIRVAERFQSVNELLDYIDKSIAAAAKQRKEKDGDRVLLMSIHRSKGLEWPCVWVVGCNQMILPHAKGDLEEERRLFYVAITRARDSVVCSWVARMAMKQGMKEMQPSRFLIDAGLMVASNPNPQWLGVAPRDEVDFHNHTN